MKKKIAILGGGLGSMTAAFWLTEKPGWQDDYEITVYQLGWRLGGKGASGRDTRPGYGDRVLEHGLHIWLGFYDNAFFTMRQMQAGLATLPKPPVQTFGSIDAAFTPQSLVTLQERFQGKWAGWPLLFPPNLDEPGKSQAHASLADLVEDALGWLRNWHDDFYTVLGESPAAAANHHAHPVFHELVALEEKLGTGVASAVRQSAHSLLSWVHDLMPGVKSLVDAELTEAHGVITGALRLCREAALLALRGRFETDLPARRFFITLDLACSAVIGILQDGLLVRGFESADGEDFRQWLSRHGAQQMTIDSPPVEVVYDLVFGFRDGDTEQHNFAAGTCMRGLLRMLFGYRGNLMFKMNAGMGDTIFTPFYGLLKARGVRFEFFTRVLELGLAPGGSEIGSIRIQRQASVKPEVVAKGGYDPLVRVKQLDCWPAWPDFEQLVEGDALRKDPDNPGQPYNLESAWTRWPGVGESELRRGEHFDLVLLGISIAALPEICGPLLAKSEAWRKMVDTVATTPTQSAQLWLNHSAAALGWQVPEFAKRAEAEWERQHGRKLGITGLVGAYQNPTNTWADMSHLLPEEDWPAGDDPKNVSYLVGPLPAPDAWPPYSDHGFPRRMFEQVRRDATAWTDANAGVLFPKGHTQAHRGALDPKFLVDPKQRRGPERFDAQFYRVNIDPTERYVLSVKGSTQARIAGPRSGFTNLVLAGDWTYNRVLNAGCVEATVASGMEAAQAICGYPQHIVGDSDTERQR